MDNLLMFHTGSEGSSNSRKLQENGEGWEIVRVEKIENTYNKLRVLLIMFILAKCCCNSSSANRSIH